MPKCNQCGKSGPFLKLNDEGLCQECQLKQLASMKSALSSEELEYVSLQEASKKLEQYHSTLQSEVTALRQEIERKKQQLVQMDEEILWQEFALYQPRYSFCSSDEYKNRLAVIRQQQKDMIKAGTALVTTQSYSGWVYSENMRSARIDPKLVRDMSKLILRAFNSECEEVVDKVKYNNFDVSLKRISASRDAISKLGALFGVSISPAYYASKVDELTLALEYQQKKEQEREQQKELRARMREEAKLQRELEEQRRTAEKEQSHYLNALARIEAQLLRAQGEDKAALEEKKQEIADKLDSIDAALKSIDYRQANQKAGYVYIISNVGSFGENVYKIGMTRRLDPTERVDELGDASVPFDFDIHAMIFSEDAPALEAALHKAFESRKVNLVNPRREFFYATLEEIKAVVKQNYDKTAEFIEVADAEQYRISKKMRGQM